MRVRCNDHWHHLSPTAMIVVIDAFQEGDLFSTKTHTPRCIRFAFTADRVARLQRFYKGNNITFDMEDQHGSSPPRPGHGKAPAQVRELPT